MPVATSVQGSGPRVDRRRLAADARRLLAHLGLGRSELSLLLCDDQTIRPLNQDWRGKDSATDVLSFPQEEAVAPGSFASPPPVLGDVVISTETAARQAAEVGIPLEAEVRVLLVHGLLHLVGHDHEDDEEAAALMSSAEADLLRLLGLDPVAALVARAR